MKTETGATINEGGPAFTAYYPLKRALASYRLAKAKLEAVKAECFPPGTRMQVYHPHYHGPGEIVHDPTCGIEWVPVCIENGNVWHYPIESVALTTTTTTNI